MPTYIMMGRFTSQGKDKIRGSPARIDTARETMSTQGAELKAWYVVNGQFDYVAIIEAPDEETRVHCAAWRGGNRMAAGCACATERANAADRRVGGRSRERSADRRGAGGIQGSRRADEVIE